MVNMRKPLFHSVDVLYENKIYYGNFLEILLFLKMTEPGYAEHFPGESGDIH